MQNDLISRSALIAEIDRQIAGLPEGDGRDLAKKMTVRAMEGFKRIINGQPTACDAEQLVKENKALKNRCRIITGGVMCFSCPLECENRTEEYRGDVSGRE